MPLGLFQRHFSFGASNLKRCLALTQAALCILHSHWWAERVELMEVSTRHSSMLAVGDGCTLYLAMGSLRGQKNKPAVPSLRILRISL